MSLQVDATNSAAIALYLSLGYTIVGEDEAVTTPSSSPLTTLLLGGAKKRSLLAFQKPRPAPEPAPSAEESQGAKAGGTALGRWPMAGFAKGAPRCGGSFTLSRRCHHHHHQGGGDHPPSCRWRCGGDGGAASAVRSATTPALPQVRRHGRRTSCVQA